MTSLRRLLQGGFKLMDAVMAVFLLIMIVLVFANVVLRYGFAGGILGSVEVSRFLFVWIVMLGAVACLRSGEHLQLLSVVEAMPPGVRTWLGRAVQALIILCSLMLALGSLRQTFANWANPQPMSGIPVGAVYLAGAVGGALMALIAALRLFGDPGDGDKAKTRGDVA